MNNEKDSNLDLSSSKYELLMNRYIINDKIGKGTFSKIYKAYDTKLNILVAVKLIKNTIDQKYKKLFEKEIEILKNLDHPNIIKLYNYIQTKDKIYIVTEFCDRGDLSRYIKQTPNDTRNIKMTLGTVEMITKQLSKGIEYLRTCGIIHRDLKPHNIFMDSNGIIKIGDFGFAKASDETDLSSTICGSPIYMAPEIVFYKNYTSNADLWSIGVILYQLVYAETPIKALNILDLQKKIKEVAKSGIQFPDNQVTKEIQSSGLKDLISNLLIVDPKKRITFNAFFNHPFVSEPEKNNLIDNYQPVSLSSSLASVPSLNKSTTLQSDPLQSISLSSTIKGISIKAGSSYVTFNSGEIRKIKKPKTNVFNSKAGPAGSSGCLQSTRTFRVAELSTIHKQDFEKYTNTLLKLSYGLSNEKDKLHFYIKIMSLIESINGPGSDIMKENWDYCNKEANKLKMNYPTIDTKHTMKLIYSLGLQRGKSGAIYELHNEYTKSKECYTESLTLLKILLLDLKIENDRAVIKELYDSVNHRLKISINK